jgi:predicted lipid-binding transport protein (Tim44 family)
VTVRFESQLISQVSAAQAQAQGAEEAKPVDHMDDWTFARALGSRDPNWLLVGTQAVQPS